MVGKARGKAFDSDLPCSSHCHGIGGHCLRRICSGFAAVT